MSNPHLPGYVEIVATLLNEPDDEGLILAPGCLSRSRSVVLISDYDHSILQGDEAMGMGSMCEEGSVLVFRGRYDIWLPRPRAVFDLLQVVAPRVRWSIGFDILESHEEVRAGKRVKVVTQADVWEISPVSKPASKGTYTRAITPA